MPICGMICACWSTLASGFDLCYFAGGTIGQLERVNPLLILHVQYLIFNIKSLIQTKIAGSSPVKGEGGDRGSHCLSPLTPRPGPPLFE
jgi:hypothetical protein